MEKLLVCLVIMLVSSRASYGIALQDSEENDLKEPTADLHRLARFQRNIADRFNINEILGPVLRSGDVDACRDICQSYSENERQRAMNDPLRGPNARNRNWRSGIFTLYFRYFQLYDFILDFCNGFCDRMEVPETTTPEAPTTTEMTTAATTEELTTTPEATTPPETTTTIAETTATTTEAETTTTVAETTTTAAPETTMPTTTPSPDTTTPSEPVTTGPPTTDRPT